MIKQLTRLVFAAMTLMMMLQVRAQRVAPAAYSGNIKISYIRTWDASSPQLNPDTLAARSFKDVKQATQYFDGLGRPVQTVIKQGSLISGGTAYDIVSANVYDSFG